MSSIVRKTGIKKQRQSIANIQTQISQARKLTKSNVSRSKSISKKKLCGDLCKKHDFELKPMGYSCFLSKGVTQPITVNFCSRGNSTTIPIPIIPLQLAKEPQVPLFISHDEIRKYQHYKESHREQFKDAINKANKMLDQDQNQVQQIIKPIPKTKNCQICKLKIDTEQEYQKHINSFDHKIGIKKSMGQKYILQQTEAFKLQKQEQLGYDRILAQIVQVSNIMKDAKHILKGLIRKKIIQQQRITCFRQSSVNL